MTANKTAATRRRRRSGVSRGNPRPCGHCRTPIAFGRVADEHGAVQIHQEGKRKGHPVLVVLTAEPTPVGEWLFLRGTPGSPVVRYIADDFERLTAQGLRYREHKDTPREER